MNLPAFLSIFGVICYSVLIYAVISSPASQSSLVRRRFLVSLVVMVCWQIAALVVSLARRENVAMIGYDAMAVCVSAFGVAYALFIRAFLGKKRTGVWLTGGILLCAAAAIFIAVDQTGVITSVYWNDVTRFYLPVFGPWLPVASAPYALALMYVLVLLVHGYRRARSPIDRERIRYLLIGWFTIVLGMVANLSPTLKAYPFDLLANIINGALIAYVILRYRFLDITFVIRQVLAYAIATMIIATGYFLIVFFVQQHLRTEVGYQVFLVAFLVAAITASFVQSLRDKAQLWVDRLLFRDRYDARLMLQELSDLATSILDIEELTALLLDRVMRTMHPRRVSLLVREQEGAGFRLAAQRGDDGGVGQVFLAPTHPVVQRLADHPKPLTRHHLIQHGLTWCNADGLSPANAPPVQAPDGLATLDAQLFIPLMVRGRLVGILVLSSKRSGASYNRDDLLILTTLSNQVAIAIENARLFGEVQAELGRRKRAQSSLEASQAALRRRTARLELLRDLDVAILEARDLNGVVETALRRTRVLLACEGAGLITLHDDDFDAGAGSAAARIGEAGGVDPDGFGYRDHEAFEQLQKGDVYVVDDLAAAPSLLSRDQKLHMFGYRSALLVPVLRRHPGQIETIVLLATTPGAFGDEEREIGRDVAYSLALVIRHTEMRLEIQARAEALEQQLTRASLFNEITRAIAAQHDLDGILSVVAQRLEQDFADHVSAWFGDGASAEGAFSEGTLTEGDLFAQDGPPASRGTPDGEVDPLNRFVLDTAIPELQALRAGDLVYLRDLARLEASSPDGEAFSPDGEAFSPDGEAFSPDGVVQDLEVRSVVVVPLVVERTVSGFVVCARRQPRAFSHAERDFLRGLGEHVTLAVHQTQLHEALEAAYTALQQTQRTMMRQERLRVLGQMASGIAHDINNAISPIPLYLGLIRRKVDLPPGIAAYLDVIKTAASDVEGTVRRMQYFYRERDATAFRSVDVNNALQQVIELTRPKWRDLPQETGITIHLETDFQADLPLVMGDEAEIRQAVTNLMLNAVDAMPDGGVLSLRTGQIGSSPPQVFLEVQDTGIGMTEEIRERAVEPFFSTKGARGSGLGLAMVYGTLQRHDGMVDISSAPGEGTTVRLTFPVREEVAPAPAPEVVAPPPALHILCVDDERLLREALRETLVSAGHEVAVANGGLAGLDAFRTASQTGAPFDVVITDLGMPYVDGRMVARMIKAEAPGTPVILLTGWAQRLRTEGTTPPFVDLVLGKPTTLASLSQALAQVASGEQNADA